MSTVNYAWAQAAIFANPGGQPFTARWPLANTDVGQSIAVANLNLKSVQVEGTFGAGGTIVWEGSVDGTTFHTLPDKFGVALSMAASALALADASVVLLRPRCSAGDGTTALVATALFLRSQTP